MASQTGLPRCPEGHVTAYMTVTPREPGLAQWKPADCFLD